MKVRFIGTANERVFIPEKVYEVISIERGWYRIMTELATILQMLMVVLDASGITAMSKGLMCKR